MLGNIKLYACRASGSDKYRWPVGCAGGGSAASFVVGLRWVKDDAFAVRPDGGWGPAQSLRVVCQQTHKPVTVVDSAPGSAARPDIPHDHGRLFANMTGRKSVILKVALTQRQQSQNLRQNPGGHP